MVLDGIEPVRPFLIRPEEIDARGLLRPLFMQYGKEVVNRIGIELLGYPPAWDIHTADFLKLQAELQSRFSQ